MGFSEIEKEVFKKYRLVVGIDEAGRGAWAGPVVAAAVAISSVITRRSDEEEEAIRGQKLYFTELPASPCSLVAIKGRDSKQLSEKQREKIFEAIKNDRRIEWRTSAVWPKTIDKINIWQATLLAWRRCLKKLNLYPPKFGQAKFERAGPDFLFLDGKFNLFGRQVKYAWPRPKKCSYDTLSPVIHSSVIQGGYPIIKGDQKIFLLSLASIIAKVTRDRLMKKLDKKYPQYALAQHKGYGTKLHLVKLKKYGPCSIHRRSFRPVFEVCPFKEKVYYLVSQIPRGQVMTYQEVAEKIGHPRAARAVGNALNQNTDLKIPCHRIIRSDGSIGGYNQGVHIKRLLLEQEKNIRLSAGPAGSVY